MDRLRSDDHGDLLQLVGASRSPGKVYSEGLVYALFALNVPLSGACVYLFGRKISAVGRKHGFVTPADMIAEHYGSEALRILVAVTGLLYVLPYVVMQIKAGGILFDVLLDAPLTGFADNFTVGCVVLSLVTTIYVMIGGMRSVAWTDVAQGTFLIAGMLAGGYVVIEVLGGLAEFSERVSSLPDAWLTAPGVTGEWTPLFLFTVCLFGSTGSMITPAQWMRYYAADSSRTLRRSAIIFAVVLTACFLFGVMLVGIGGQVLYPAPTENGAPVFVGGKLAINEALSSPDDILILVLRDQVPRVFPVVGIWIVSVLLMAIAAASMSTADSNLHAMSAVLTRDVYDRYIRPDAGPRERTWIGRGVILAVTIAALVLVIGSHEESLADRRSALVASMDMIVDIGIVAISFSAQLLPITADMLWLRRGRAAGAVLGLVAGLVTTTCVWQLGPPFAGAEIGGVEISMMDGAWGLLANVLVFGTVTALSPRSAQA